MGVLAKQLQHTNAMQAPTLRQLRPGIILSTLTSLLECPLPKWVQWCGNDAGSGRIGPLARRRKTLEGRIAAAVPRRGTGVRLVRKKPAANSNPLLLHRPAGCIKRTVFTRKRSASLKWGGR